MARNDTRAKRRNQAQEDLALKLRHEVKLSKEMRAVLERIAKDLDKLYTASGRIVDAGSYRNDIERDLKTAYKRAADDFGTGIIDHIDKNKTDIEDLMVGAIVLLAAMRGTTVDREISTLREKNAAKLDAMIRNNSGTGASRITGTNQDEIHKAVERAIAKAAKNGDMSRDAIAKDAANNFRQTALWRASTIAATEIQQAAEGAKLIEATTFASEVAMLDLEDGEVVPGHDLGDAAELVAVYAALPPPTKEWHTMGDEKVREAHADADYQSIDASEPFEVGGEKMMYPGDESLGATAGNIINCRCTAAYSYGGDAMEGDDE